MRVNRALTFQNLVILMNSINTSNRQMAKECFISYSTFSMKMAGHHDWKLAEMLTIQNYINKKTGKNYTLDYLFTKEKWKKW